MKTNFAILIMLISNVTYSISTEECYLIKADVKSKLTASSNEIFISFAPGFNTANRRTVTDRFIDPDNIKDEEFFSSKNAIKIILKTDITPLQINLLKSLISVDAIESVYPVYFYKSSPLYANNTVILRLKKDHSENQLISFISSITEYEIIENYQTADNRNEYLIKINKHKNIFDISNKIYESGFVEYAHPNFTYRATADRIGFIPNDEYFPGQWFLNQPSDNDIDAPEAWDYIWHLNNTPPLIAVIDGHATDRYHPELQVNLSFTYNAYLGNNEVQLTENQYDNHGTPCTGIIGALTNNFLGVASVGAAKFDVVPVKIGHNIQSNGGFYFDDNNMVRTKNHLLHPNISNRLAAVSCSWGSSLVSASIQSSLRDLHEQPRSGLGAVILFSMGNQNQNVDINEFCKLDFVVGVGATDMNDRKSWFSNYGPYLDVVAPGENIFTTDHEGSPGYHTGDYCYFSGTSAACPVAAGVIGLIAFRNPGVTANTCENLLYGTCDKAGGYNYSNFMNSYFGRNDSMGYGRINAKNCLQVNAFVTRVIPEGQYLQSQRLHKSDTVKVYLSNTNPPYNFLDSSESTIDSVSFFSYLNFKRANSGEYYIAVTHRNSIQTWSSEPGYFDSNYGGFYNFTDDQSAAFGNNLKFLNTYPYIQPFRYGIYSGDVNQDGSVDLTDNQMIDNDAINFVNGYVNTDLNYDNFVDLIDAAIADNNSFNYVSISRP